MRSIRFTFKRKYDDVNNKNEKGEPQKLNYGDSFEEITYGKEKGTKVPVFSIENDLVPETANELMEQLETDDNFARLMDWVFETAILTEVRAYFNKQKISSPTQEQTEEGRKEVLKRCKEIGKKFTLSSLFAEAISATTAIDELNSSEMQELAKTDPVAFTKRVTELMARLK